MTDIDVSKHQIATIDEASEVSAPLALSGKVFPPKQHLLLFDADDWEEFVLEWAQFQKTKYHTVTRLGGAYDFGVDVACFYSDQGFLGEWDNYQCKYYKGAPLAPGTAIPEIGKIFWHAFNKKISLPKRYFFFAPKDCGPSLKKLLLDSHKLKEKLFERWDDWCRKEITSTQCVDLEGEFLSFVQGQDFSRFQYKPTHDVIEEHRQTPFFIPRFGGGFPDRPSSSSPPIEILEAEARYIDQILEAYSDAEKSVVCIKTLALVPKFEAHFGRQRESFFHAESLRSFARDSVPFGTFEALQDEILSGVIDVSEADHDNGFARLNSVTSAAKQLNLTANSLIQVTKMQDRQGICHQLANGDRLTWVPSDD